MDMSNLKALLQVLVFFSLLQLGRVAASWRLDERRKVMEVISALKEPKCPAIVVVLDTYAQPDDADANDFLVDMLVKDYPHPLTLLETSSSGSLDVRPKSEPVCSNVVIVSDQPRKLQSLYRQVKDLYYVHTALVVLTQGTTREIDAVVVDAKNENLFAVLERPGRMVEIRFWTVDDVVHSNRVETSSDC
jgi:mannose/fructose/N-acetylgalactosamine-specific phosphotransferase system component IIB